MWPRIYTATSFLRVGSFPASIGDVTRVLHDQPTEEPPARLPAIAASRGRRGVPDQPPSRVEAAGPPRVGRGEGDADRPGPPGGHQPGRRRAVDGQSPAPLRDGPPPPRRLDPDPLDRGERP